uniref:Putative hemolectin n=1 Tax=Tityus obscurus TaxID=1221240 RepID=A0A1E1WVL7_TITOB
MIYITIETRRFEIFNEGGDLKIMRENKKLSIPGRVENLNFFESNGFLVLESSFGFRLRWDGSETVLVTVESFLKNKTCGLCGQYFGSSGNHMFKANGELENDVIEFANSWKILYDEQEECNSVNVGKHVCKYKTEEERIIFQKSHATCNEIFDNIIFSDCKEHVPIDIFKRSCRLEFCACRTDNFKCICSTLAEYLRECIRLGGRVSGNWREVTNCSIDCPEGMIPGQCDRDCPKTCQGAYYLCSDQTCVDYCRCPEELVLDNINGRCVPEENCPCIFQNRQYAAGEKRRQDCNECECVKGSWYCTNNPCEARCVASGNNHYTTFDGKKI